VQQGQGHPQVPGKKRQSKIIYMNTVENSQIILSPDNIPVLSKQNAATFHHLAKQRIYDTGNGLFEYIETVNFFAALKDRITGNSSSKIEPDKDFVEYVREQIKLNGEKDVFKSLRGVKFEVAETGTSYDFTICGDPTLVELEEAAKVAAEKLKERKEFLKKVPAEGTDLLIGDELVKVFPPAKSSKSSFKVTLPK
jgi:hypothetical protein